MSQKIYNRMDSLKVDLELVIRRIQPNDGWMLALNDHRKVYGPPSDEQVFLTVYHHSLNRVFARIDPCMIDKLVQKSDKFVEEKVEGFRMTHCDNKGKPGEGDATYDLMDAQGILAALFGLLVCLHVENLRSECG